MNNPRSDAEILTEFRERVIWTMTAREKTAWLKAILVERPHITQAAEIKQDLVDLVSDKEKITEAAIKGAEDQNSTTPSWEADFAHQFGKPVRDGVTIKLDPSGDTMLLSEKEVKAFIHSLLSRQQAEAVALGDSLLKPTSDEDEWGIAVMKQYFNEAIITYQKALEALN